jgi:hypothetical protein
VVLVCVYTAQFRVCVSTVLVVYVERGRGREKLSTNCDGPVAIKPEPTLFFNARAPPVPSTYAAIKSPPRREM